jgi:hypothetical protein
MVVSPSYVGTQAALRYCFCSFAANEVALCSAVHATPMDAGTLDLKTIFGQDRRHVVPLYQRPYVWEEKKQWEPLWSD